EASWSPTVEVSFLGNTFTLAPEGTEGESAASTFFVPPGVASAEAKITGECSGGCCEPCFDDSTFIRASSVEWVDAWQIESAADEMPMIVTSWLPAQPITLYVTS